VLAPLAVAQDKHMSRESGAWSQATSGTLAAAKNVRVKLDMGSVVLHGGSQQGISYVVHGHSYSSEEDARRQFGSFKINAVVKGDTAWIVGEWQGGRPHRFAGEFVINVVSLPQVNQMHLSSAEHPSEADEFWTRHRVADDYQTGRESGRKDSGSVRRAGKPSSSAPTIGLDS